MAASSDQETLYALAICCALTILITLVLVITYKSKAIIILDNVCFSLFILIESVTTIWSTKSDADVSSRDPLQEEINNFINSQESEMQQFGQEMHKIMNGIHNLKSRADQARQTLDHARREINTFTQSSKEAQTNIYHPPCSQESDEVLDDAQAALDTEGRKAEEMAQNLSQKGDKISEQVSIIISNLIRTINELIQIKIGSYQQVKHLKCEFTQHLSDLMMIVCNNDNLVKQFENVKTKITQSFKDIRAEIIELPDFKTEIASHIQLINSALQVVSDDEEILCIISIQ